jgi:hypothetical protein
LHVPSSFNVLVVQEKSFVRVEADSAESAVRGDFIHVRAITFDDGAHEYKRRLFQRPKFR